MISPEVLRRYPFFSLVCEKSLKRVAMISEEVRWPAETRIFSYRDPAKKLFLILHGEVELRCPLGSGEERTVDTLTDGEVVMWSALVEPYRATASGVTTRATTAVAIDAAALRDLCVREACLGFRLMTQVAKTLSNRLDETRVQLAVI